VCAVCQQLLNEAVHALTTSRAAEGTAPDEVAWGATFRPGALVGRYVIRRFIARGGMGEVYEAFDSELQERVALKTVTSTACDDPSAVRRLKAEVQLARRVSHPNVCRIYDFGSHCAPEASPIAFLTMEFVDGETLGLRLRQSGALPVDQALAVAKGLLRGLDAAHRAGVLHRDFKSDNVILHHEGDRVEPRILDFGLARALDHSAGPSSSQGGGLVGTLAYMAPEQLEGHPFTIASDIYSFGLVCFEMLTGQLPFKGRSSPALTTLERLTKAVPAPSTKNPLVSAQLDALVLACLRRHPHDRPQTAAEALQRLDSLELEAQAPRSGRRAFAALALVGLAVGATTGSLLSLSRTPPAGPLSVTTRAARASDPATPTNRKVESHATVAPTVSSLSLPAVVPSPSPAAKVKVHHRPIALLPEPPVAAVRPPRETWRVGWENPFAPRALPSSSQLGAVLNQALDDSAPARNSELPESRR
jgi:serine/threonine protein kinase